MNTDCIDKYLQEHLTPKRLRHTYGVRDEAIRLASKYNVNIEKAEIAALCHDMFRCLSDEETNTYIDKLGLPDRYKNNRNLAHGKIAAAMIPEVFHIEDEEIKDAIAYHTTGKPNMSKLAQVVFLADAIEPGRHYPGVEKVRKYTDRSLDEGCLYALSHNVDFICKQDVPLDKDTLLARDYYRTKEILNGK